MAGATPLKQHSATMSQGRRGVSLLHRGRGTANGVVKGGKSWVQGKTAFSLCKDASARHIGQPLLKP